PQCALIPVSSRANEASSSTTSSRAPCTLSRYQSPPGPQCLSRYYLRTGASQYYPSSRAPVPSPVQPSPGRLMCPLIPVSSRPPVPRTTSSRAPVCPPPGDSLLTQCLSESSGPSEPLLLPPPRAPVNPLPVLPSSEPLTASPRCLQVYPPRLVCLSDSSSSETSSVQSPRA
ncbi:leucine-rich repeat extensin-like protein 5, partial [Homarus americanus]|uniref:leucine-rich repeat extensin-like protein 5 n=1 Tax=Homarus americanus TaxID=6706 RepID=UPI001C48FCA5